MSLYQCEECGCVENTALSNYWYERSFGGQKLCSACTKIGSKPAGWHGKFERVYLPKGMFITNREGNLEHKDNGDTNFRKYALLPEPLVEESLQEKEE